MHRFLGLQQEVIDGRDSGTSSSSLRLRTFEDKTELGASRTNAFLSPSCVLSRVARNYMIVEKKSDRKNKRTEIFFLDRFVVKTRPVVRCGILLDVAHIEQRT